MALSEEVVSGLIADDMHKLEILWRTSKSGYL